MTPATVPNLMTLGRVAETLDAPVHRIEYILRTRPHIHPAARAGRFRLFNGEAIAHIRHELIAMDAHAARGPGRG